MTDNLHLWRPPSGFLVWGGKMGRCPSRENLYKSWRGVAAVLSGDSTLQVFMSHLLQLQVRIPFRGPWPLRICPGASRVVSWGCVIMLLLQYRARTGTGLSCFPPQTSL